MSFQRSCLDSSAVAAKGRRSRTALVGALGLFVVGSNDE